VILSAIDFLTVQILKVASGLGGQISVRAAPFGTSAARFQTQPLLGRAAVCWRSSSRKPALSPTCLIIRICLLSSYFSFSIVIMSPFWPPICLQWFCGLDWRVLGLVTMAAAAAFRVSTLCGCFFQKSHLWVHVSTRLCG
jgi:hypothetical protein